MQLSGKSLLIIESVSQSITLWGRSHTIGCIGAAFFGDLWKCIINIVQRTFFKIFGVLQVNNWTRH